MKGRGEAHDVDLVAKAYGESWVIGCTAQIVQAALSTCAIAMTVKDIDIDHLATCTHADGWLGAGWQQPHLVLEAIGVEVMHTCTPAKVPVQASLEGLHICLLVASLAALDLCIYGHDHAWRAVSAL